ncbi:MAG: MBL fold metallo-hydrolase [Gemmatimonadetes bacterium]|nr:MBL fold metallo-hydrolase [Gemmatimonadota bacterium]
MRGRTFARLLVAGFLLQGSWLAYSQGPPSPRPLRTERVAGDLYLVSGDGGNVAVYVTGEGVVLVDDMFHRNHADILAHVRTITDQPLRYVLNTHQHDDHAGGNAPMLPIAEVVAHRNARANMVARRPPYFEETPGTPIGLPRVTFASELSVFLGGKEVRAHHFGRGHTNGDAAIYFPGLKAIHTGDLFLLPGGPRRAPADGRPVGVPIFVDYAQGGSFLEWTETLDGILTLDFETVIPGHGPVSTRADVERFRADLETMRTRIAGLINEGRSRDDLVSLLERDYGWRATGCPPSPPTAGCLQYQQVDALIAELRE